MRIALLLTFSGRVMFARRSSTVFVVSLVHVTRLVIEERLDLPTFFPGARPRSENRRWRHVCGAVAGAHPKPGRQNGPRCRSLGGVACALDSSTLSSRRSLSNVRWAPR